ncbi:MAG: hypothetical protein F4W68_04620 [Cenarchaeum sp. SB0661_bin_35]|nr:hypothetical protein [Cenarchaeum sp. SB0667_bin_13]MYC79097.1 hypothetical protein [Cenarchaeum sp. SB0661_bin_35]MYC79764.1 hypothetical protein [Cenarchaeum sp. SB0661_bin_35]MYI52083.1 hypothetical protein [Cenarchaeum sp. SB0673_bin_9]
MQKPTIVLLSMAAILAAGLGVSIFASQTIFGSLSIGTGPIDVGMPLEITAELEQGEGGIYAIEIMNYTEGMGVKATVLGPLRSVITSAVIQDALYEERFPVDETYQYTLVVETDFEPAAITAILGPEPGAVEASLGFVSLYMLLVGVVGMIAATVYVIIHKRRLARSGHRSSWRD